MTTRFSSESFEGPQTRTDSGKIGYDGFIPDLSPSAGYDVLTTHVLDDAARCGISTIDSDEVFIPENYEANYAYPLLVWLTSPAQPKMRLSMLMQMVSERNYFGVSVPVADSDQIETQLFETFGRLRRRFHLNTERVYLIGFGESGSQALETGLSQPGWFGGVAALSAGWPERPHLLARFRELRGKRVLLGIDDRDGVSIVSDVLYAQQLLRSAGMHVTALASGAGPERYRSLLRELDRWVMQGIEQPELVC